MLHIPLELVWGSGHRLHSEYQMATIIDYNIIQPTVQLMK